MALIPASSFLDLKLPSCAFASVKVYQYPPPLPLVRLGTLIGLISEFSRIQLCDLGIQSFDLEDEHPLPGWLLRTQRLRRIWTQFYFFDDFGQLLDSHPLGTPPSRRCTVRSSTSILSVRLLLGHSPFAPRLPYPRYASPSVIRALLLVSIPSRLNTGNFIATSFAPISFVQPSLIVTAFTFSTSYLPSPYQPLTLL